MFPTRVRELYAVCARGLQTGGENGIIFKEELTSIFQVTRFEETDNVDDCLPTYVGWDQPHDTPGDEKPHCRFL